MIYLSTDREAYRNELCEVIRVFFGMAEIGAIEAGQSVSEEDLLLRCDTNGGKVIAEGRQNGRAARYDDPYLHSDLEKHGRSALTVKKYEKRAMKSALYRVLKELTGTKPPWGSLTGIRPTRLAREFESAGEDPAVQLRERFDVSEEKIALALTILEEQRGILASPHDKVFDIYIGIPFCRTRCSYCSFAAYEVGKGCATAANIEEYVVALCKEIQENIPLALSAGYKPRSLYIGGGTPTALSTDQLHRVAKAALKASRGDFLEFTVEAGRPDTITQEKLRMLRSLGVDRVSINPQTMDDETLMRVGRAHSAKDVENAFELAKKAGFPCINMDTIIGLPGETAKNVEKTMEGIARLKPENLTVHTLAIKRSSKLKEQLESTELPAAEEAARMLAVAQGAANAMGMRPYYMYRQKFMRGNLENVGYTLPGFASIYNIDIMEEQTSILALGAGGITKWILKGGELIKRVANPKDLRTYFNTLDERREARKELIFSDQE
ncbi:MAG: coproporphyrinogen dehydrogenase HemZ [Christensenellales bacterium]